MSAPAAPPPQDLAGAEPLAEDVFRRRTLRRFYIRRSS
jgi:hypothetical protein